MREVDHEKIKQAVTMILEAIGEDPVGKACSIRQNGWQKCMQRFSKA